METSSGSSDVGVLSMENDGGYLKRAWEARFLKRDCKFHHEIVLSPFWQSRTVSGLLEVKLFWKTQCAGVAEDAVDTEQN